MGRQMVRATVTLERSDLATLDQIAEETGTSRSEAVRDLVAAESRRRELRERRRSAAAVRSCGND